MMGISMRYNFISLVSVFLATLSLAWAAAAQTPIQIEESKKHFTMGIDLFKEKKYREALDEFNKSYDLRPHWGLLYNIGICYLKLDKKGKALMVLMKYLDKGGSEVPKEKSKDVEDFIQDLANEVGIVRFKGDLMQANVLVDGEEYPEANKSFYLYLDPGKRYIRIIKGSVVLFDNKLTVKKGEEILIDLTVTGQPSMTPGAKTIEFPGVKPGITKPVVERQEPVKPKKPGRDLKIVGGIFAGLAGALIIGYAAAGARALSESSQMKQVEDEWNNSTRSTCAGHCDALLAQAEAERDSHYDKASSAKIAANVLFGLGLACAAVSIGAFIGVSRKGHKEKQTQSPGTLTALNPGIGVSPGGISLNLTF
jgi:tetratricopeptide (TPR) repeat protein